MLPQTLDPVLQELNFTSDVFADDAVMLARHASISRTYFDRSVETFEEYQRFQTARNFAKCRYVVSFLGLPERGGDATFAGVYEVLGSFTQGESGFREPQGDPDVVKDCAGQKYLYSLSRLQQFDFLRTEWEIRWNLPGPAKYQYSKPNQPIPTLRFGSASDLSGIGAVLAEQVVLQAAASEIDADALNFSEGTVAYVRHLQRERSAALVQLVKNHAKASGLYFCAICKFDFEKTYGLDYIECHHTIPVSTLKSGDTTEPEDCVLLCANCHRAVHKRKPWLEKHELHLLLR